MNILLVNTDAVVTKLVTLSTQKTGDRLDVATSIENIREESYDLLILDGGLFSRDFLEQINDKVLYAHSIFITTRESQEEDLFEKLLYKPFLPTELLLMLHLINTAVKEEQEARSKEIVFSAFDNDFFSEDEIAFEEEPEEEALVRVQRVAKPLETPIAPEPESEEQEEAFDQIFSDNDVSEVKAMLEALNSEEETPVKEEMVEEEVYIEPEIDYALEVALKNSGTIEDVSESQDLSEASLDILNEKEVEPLVRSSQNRESIETLKTLLQALENPQLARSLRGSITINLTFGDDNES